MMNSRRFALVTYVLAYAVVGCDSMSRPSESAVRQCVQATGASSDSISQVEFGNTITSQGGMMELAVGAPKGTKIFPVNVHSPSGGWTRVKTYWVFKDSFGSLKCISAPGAETRTYQTAAQVAQEAEQRRLAAQQQAEQQRMQAEQQRAQAEQQRMQAEAQRLAEERANEERQKQVRAATEALASSECRETQLPVPSKSELTFVVPSSRECWTPWLVLREAGSFAGSTESGNVLMQVVYVDGTTSEPFEEGPTKNVTLRKQLQKARFKSLGKEPITITFKVR